MNSIEEDKLAPENIEYTSAADKPEGNSVLGGINYIRINEFRMAVYYEQGLVNCR